MKNLLQIQNQNKIKIEIGLADADLGDNNNSKERKKCFMMLLKQLMKNIIINHMTMKLELFLNLVLL